MKKETNKDSEDLRYGMPHEVINGVPTDILINIEDIYPEMSIETISNILASRCHMSLKEAIRLVEEAVEARF